MCYKGIYFSYSGTSMQLTLAKAALAQPFGNFKQSLFGYVR